MPHDTYSELLFSSLSFSFESDDEGNGVSTTRVPPPTYIFKYGCILTDLQCEATVWKSDCKLTVTEVDNYYLHKYL